MRNDALATLEWVAVLRLDCVGDASAEGDGVHGRTLTKPPEHGQLCPQHVPFMHRREGPPGFAVQATDAIGNERASGIDHHGCRALALISRGLLRAEKAGL